MIDVAREQSAIVANFVAALESARVAFGAELLTKFLGETEKPRRVAFPRGLATPSRRPPAARRPTRKRLRPSGPVEQTAPIVNDDRDDLNAPSPSPPHHEQTASPPSKPPLVDEPREDAMQLRPMLPTEMPKFQAFTAEARKHVWYGGRGEQSSYERRVFAKSWELARAAGFELRDDGVICVREGA